MRAGRGIVVVAAAGAVFALGWSIQAEAGTARLVCGSPHSSTVVQTKRLRVYTRPQPSAAAGSGVFGKPAYGCLRGQGSSRLLNAVGREEGDRVRIDLSLAAFAIRAPLLAYSEAFFGKDTSRTMARTLNLRTGANSGCAVGAALAPNPSVQVAAIVLAPSGDTGWVAKKRSFRSSAPTLTVGVCEGESRRVLEEGGEVDPASLQLHGTTLSWEVAGEMRSAELR